MLWIGNSLPQGRVEENETAGFIGRLDELMKEKGTGGHTDGFWWAEVWIEHKHWREQVRPVLIEYILWKGPAKHSLHTLSILFLYLCGCLVMNHRNIQHRKVPFGPPWPLCHLLTRPASLYFFKFQEQSKYLLNNVIISACTTFSGSLVQIVTSGWAGWNNWK